MSIIKIAHEKSHFAGKRTEKDLENDFYIAEVKRKSKICIVNCVPCILVYKSTIGKFVTSSGKERYSTVRLSF